MCITHFSVLYNILNKFLLRGKRRIGTIDEHCEASLVSWQFLVCLFFPVEQSIQHLGGGGGPHLTACRVLVPRPGIELPGFLAVKAPSPNYWTNREFLPFNF